MTLPSLALVIQAQHYCQPATASTECSAILLIGGRAQKHCQTDIVTKMNMESEKDSL